MKNINIMNQKRGSEVIYVDGKGFLPSTDTPKKLFTFDVEKKQMVCDFIFVENINSAGLYKTKNTENIINKLKNDGYTNAISIKIIDKKIERYSLSFSTDDHTFDVLKVEKSIFHPNDSIIGNINDIPSIISRIDELSKGDYGKWEIISYINSIIFDDKFTTLVVGGLIGSKLLENEIKRLSEFRNEQIIGMRSFISKDSAEAVAREINTQKIILH